MRALDLLRGSFIFLLFIFLIFQSGFAARYVSAVVLDAPTSDPNILRTQTFTMQCHWEEGGTGAPVGTLDLYAQYDNGTNQATWYDIPTSNGLTTQDSNPQNVDNDEIAEWTVTGNVPKVYYVRCICKDCPTSTGTGDVVSSSQQVTVHKLAPTFSDGGINETLVFVGNAIKHYLQIDEYPEWYIFSWNGTDGCTGGWSNSTPVQVSGDSYSVLAEHVEVPGSGCAGKAIGWRFWANNSNGTWTASDIKIYNVYKYGWINITWAPDSSIDETCTSSNPCQIDVNTTFNISVLVSCEGGEGAHCGSVYIGARYNASSSLPDTLISETQGDKPFYIYDTGQPDTVAYWRPISWSVANLNEGVILDPENASDLRYDDNTTYTYINNSVSEPAAHVNYSFFIPSNMSEFFLVFTYVSGSNADYLYIYVFNFDTSSFDEKYVAASTTITTDMLNLNQSYIDDNGYVLVKAHTTVTVGTAKVYLYDIYIQTTGNSYDFWEKDGHQAFKGEYSSLPDPGAGTEFNSTEYMWVNQSDDRRVCISAEVNGNYEFQQFKFKLNESIDSINGIYIRWEGYGDLGGVRFYVWNFTNSSWLEIGILDNADETDSILNFSLTKDNYNLHDLVNTRENTMWFAVRSNDTYQGGIAFTTCTDYIQINIDKETHKNPQFIPLLLYPNQKKIVFYINATKDGFYSLDANASSSFSQIQENKTDPSFLEVIAPLVVPTLKRYFTSSVSLYTYYSTLENLYRLQTTTMSLSFSAPKSVKISTFFTSVFNIDHFYSKAFGIFRFFTDTLSSNYLTSKILTASRHLVDTLTSTEIYQRSAKFFKYITETISSYSQYSLSERILKLIKDTVSLTESKLKTMKLYRILVESFSSFSKYTRIVRLREILTDALSITQTISKSVQIAVTVIKEYVTSTLKLASSVTRIQVVFHKFISTLSSSFSVNRINVIVRNFVDSLSTSALVNRIEVVYKQIIDSLSSTFSITKIEVLFKRITDSVSSAFSLKRLAILRKQITDTLSSTISISRIETIFKQITDAISSSALFTRAEILFRAIADSISSAFSVNKLAIIVRQITDTISSNHITQKIEILFKQITDFISSNYNISRINKIFRMIFDQITSSSITSKTVYLFKQFTDTLSSSQVIEKINIVFHGIIDAISSSHITSRIETLYRTIISSISSIDVRERLIRFYRTVSDSLSIDSFISWVSQLTYILKRYFSDSLSISEVRTTLFNFVHLIVDTISSNALTTRIMTLYRSLVDTITSNKITVSVVSIYRSFVDTVSQSQVVERIIVMVKSITDSISSTASINRIVRTVHMLVDSLSQTFSTSKLAIIVRQLTDTITSSQIVIKIEVIFRQLVDSITSTFSINRIETIVKQVFDTISSSMSVNRIAIAIRKIVDTITSTASINKFAVIVKKVIDSITSSHIVTRIEVVFKQITDTLSSTISISRIETIFKQITDIISSSALPSRVVSLFRYVLDTVSSVDISERVAILFKQITDSLSFTHIVERVAVLYRNLITTISSVDIKSRIVFVYRKIVDTISTSHIVSKITQLVTVFKRYLTSAISISDYSSRVATLVHTITERMNLGYLTSRVVMIFRYIQDAISTFDLITFIKRILKVPPIPTPGISGGIPFFHEIIIGNIPYGSVSHRITLRTYPSNIKLSVFTIDGDIIGTTKVKRGDIIRIREGEYYFVFWGERLTPKQVRMSVKKDTSLFVSLEPAEFNLEMKLKPETQLLEIRLENGSVVNKLWVFDGQVFGINSGVYLFKFKAPGYLENNITISIDRDLTIISQLKSPLEVMEPVKGIIVQPRKEMIGIAFILNLGRIPIVIEESIKSAIQTIYSIFDPVIQGASNLLSPLISVLKTITTKIAEAVNTILSPIRSAVSNFVKIVNNVVVASLMIDLSKLFFILETIIDSSKQLILENKIIAVLVFVGSSIAVAYYSRTRKS